MVDATFDRVCMYDQQFRLRKSLNPTRPWSQVDGVLWLRFVAKGASGIQIITTILNKENAMILISKETYNVHISNFRLLDIM